MATEERRVALSFDSRLRTLAFALLASPRELVEEVMAGVREFTVGEPQSDDITLLVVRYRGGA